VKKINRFFTGDWVNRARVHRDLKPTTNPPDAFVEVTQAAWDNFASRGNWSAAAELAEHCATRRPTLYYGWENWAWALHKQGQTREAYELLLPLLRNLKFPGAPSGRAAWCLACFCAALGQETEAKRWLRLASVLAQDKSIFHFHTLREPDLQSLWTRMAEMA